MLKYYSIPSIYSHIFNHYFIIWIYTCFTYTTASITVTDGVVDCLMHRIFNTNLWYTSAPSHSSWTKSENTKYFLTFQCLYCCFLVSSLFPCCTFNYLMTVASTLMVNAFSCHPAVRRHHVGITTPRSTSEPADASSTSSSTTAAAADSLGETTSRRQGRRRHTSSLTLGTLAASHRPSTSPPSPPLMPIRWWCHCLLLQLLFAALVWWGMSE